MSKDVDVVWVITVFTIVLLRVQRPVLSAASFIVLHPSLVPRPFFFFFVEGEKMSLHVL